MGSPIATHFRVHARRPVRLRAIVTHNRARWERDATVINLALGGAAIMINEALAEGDAVTIKFVAPTLWDPLALQARVTWITPPTQLEPVHAGLAFEHQDAAAVLALFELVGSLSFGSGDGPPGLGA